MAFGSAAGALTLVALAAFGTWAYKRRARKKAGKLVDPEGGNEHASVDHGLPDFSCASEEAEGEPDDVSLSGRWSYRSAPPGIIR